MVSQAYQVYFKIRDTQNYFLANNEFEKILENFWPFVNFLKKESKLISIILRFEYKNQSQQFLKFFSSIKTYYGQIFVQKIDYDIQIKSNTKRQLINNFNQDENYFGGYQTYYLFKNSKTHQFYRKKITSNYNLKQIKNSFKSKNIRSNQNYKIQLDKILIFSNQQNQEIKKLKSQTQKRISSIDFFLGFETFEVFNTQAILNLKQYIIQHKLILNSQNQIKITNFNMDKTYYYNLVNLYGIFGNICLIVMNKKNNYCFIQFNSSFSVQLALQYTRNLQLFGENINTVNNPNDQVNLLRMIDSRTEEDYIYIVSKRHWRYRSDRSIKLNPISNKLHITNLTQDVREEDIFNLFGYVHYPSKIVKVYYRQRLMYVVEFEKTSEATDILAVFHNTSLNNRSMIISFSFKFMRNQ